MVLVGRSRLPSSSVELKYGPAISWPESSEETGVRSGVTSGPLPHPTGRCHRQKKPCLVLCQKCWKINGLSVFWSTMRVVSLVRLAGRWKRSPTADWDNLFAVNTRAAFYFAQAVFTRHEDGEFWSYCQHFPVEPGWELASPAFKAMPQPRQPKSD